MNDWSSSVYFGISISIITYFIGKKLQDRLHLSVCNPLVTAVLLIIGFLKIFHIPYADYAVGGSVIRIFLAPVTVCLALPVYREIRMLKRYILPVLLGCTAGCAASVSCVFFLCGLFHLNDTLTVSLLPKSVTTAVACSLSEAGGGIESITVFAVVYTGILGNVLAPVMCRIFRVKNPVEEGLAIGTCSHAVGTAKAFELGEIQGAMSSLAMAVCGMITVLLLAGG